jgi:hypothetical protein
MNFPTAHRDRELLSEYPGRTAEVHTMSDHRFGDDRHVDCRNVWPDVPQHVRARPRLVQSDAGLDGAGVMGATMAVIMLSFMLKMYENKAENITIIVGSIVMFARARSGLSAVRRPSLTSPT